MEVKVSLRRVDFHFRASEYQLKFRWRMFKGLKSAAESPLMNEEEFWKDRSHSHTLAVFISSEVIEVIFSISKMRHCYF